MNTELQKLYTDMLNVVQVSDAFEYKDHISPAGGTYRIFSYRLAQYSDYLLPGAMQARGTMFRLDANGNAVELAARTPEKFFNAYENPMTMFDDKLNIDDVELAMVKMDGSLISTFMDVDGVIRTKSHSSLSSDHALNSTALLHQNAALFSDVQKLHALGYTVNLEYISPVYRIVMPYTEDDLVVLNARHRETGEYMSVLELSKYDAAYTKSVFNTSNVIHETFPRSGSLRSICEDVRENFRGTEGFVVRLKSGQHFKIKTNWYCNLHYNKESITVPSRLFAIALNKQTDDLRQLFADDTFTLECISIMERIVFTGYNSLVEYVESFVQENKHLERKEFAIKVQTSVPSDMSRRGLIFTLLDGKEPDYAGAITKAMSSFLDEYLTKISSM